MCIKTTYSQFYYGSQLEFGKNRMQYQSFNWTYFDFERFRVYLYEGGQEIAKYAATSIDRQLLELLAIKFLFILQAPMLN